MKAAGGNILLYMITGLLVISILALCAYYVYAHYNDPANPNIVITSPENIPAATPPISEEQPAAPTPKPLPAQEPTLNGTGETVAIVLTIDPAAPCPSGQYSCIRTGIDSKQDPDCPSYKPVWAYYSNDKGMSWKRAGCYATEIDATKGIITATDTAVPPKKAAGNNAKPPKHVPPMPNASVPSLPAAPVIEPHSTAAIPPTVNEPEGYQAKFKGAFGLTVEKRTYRTAEMKQKALNLWDKERKLLEPDGSINEKYAAQPQSSGLIPGH